MKIFSFPLKASVILLLHHQNIISMPAININYSSRSTFNKIKLKKYIDVNIYIFFLLINFILVFLFFFQFYDQSHLVLVYLLDIKINIKQHMQIIIVVEFYFTLLFFSSSFNIKFIYIICYKTVN